MNSIKVFSGKFLIVLFLFSTASFMSSCGKGDSDDSVVISVDFESRDGVDRIMLYNTSNVTGAKTGDVKWTCSGQMEITSSGNNAYLLIPDNDRYSITDVTLRISAGGITESLTKSVTIPPMTWNRRYGLGEIYASASNDVNYDWYVDQGSTGPYSSINCGPSCTEMAIKWSTGNTVSTETLRQDMSSDSAGWWYTSDITAALNHYYVPNYTVGTDGGSESLIRELRQGNIAILCLDIYYVRQESRSDWRLDKFYSTSSAGAGHFIVVKGYYDASGGMFLECYDPWSIGRKYGDGQFKGMDRYYRAEDIVKATDVWWKYAIIVREASGGSYSERAFSPVNQIIDPATIPDARANISFEKIEINE